MKRPKSSKRSAAKRQPPKKTAPAVEPAADAGGPSAVEPPSDARGTTLPTVPESVPTPWVRGVLSFAVVTHLAALSLSLLGVVEPSETHARLLAAVNPYLRLTHFGADDRPVYLAHGDASEQPHRLQVRREDDDDAKWQTIGPPHENGLAQADRYRRWLGTIANLAESDQPGLVAVLLIPEIERLTEQGNDRSIKQVRIARLPTQLTTVADDAQPPPYLANVVYADRQVSLVQIKEGRLNAKPLGDSSEQPPMSASSAEGSPVSPAEASDGQERSIKGDSNE
tara:strand:+ start:239381 stop:240226 length:846 start_codon:yes stop_codon:yes gene_type:complete